MWGFELMRWTSAAGRSSEGVLSAPESEEEGEAEEPLSPDGGWGEDTVLETAETELHGGRGETREWRDVRTHGKTPDERG